MMTTDSDTVAASEDHLQAKATDDSSRFEYFEVVPLAADADGSCTTECVSEDWSAEVKQEDMAGVKEEPVDVCCIIFGTFGLLLQSAETLYSFARSFLVIFNAEHVTVSTVYNISVSLVFACTTLC